MDKIVFLCTGNTCRSPMAEGLFRARQGEERLRLKADSAGIYTQNGIPVTENAIAAVRPFGAEIEGHMSQILTPTLVAEARYLVCMTGAHYDRLLELYPAYKEKIFVLSPHDVDDPFGGDLEVYQQTAEQINEAIKQFIAQLEKRV